MKRRTIFFLLLIPHFLFGNIFFIDPLTGSINNDGSELSPWSTLHDVITTNKIELQHYQPLPYSSTSQLVTVNQGAPVKAGDTLMLRSGLHGALVLNGAYNSVPITIMAEYGHEPILSKINLAGASNWILKGLTVSGEPYNAFAREWLVQVRSHDYQGPALNIELNNLNIYSVKDCSPWGQDEWLKKAGHGIFLSGSHMLAENNNLSNVYHGIIVEADSSSVIKNHIRNFAGDGIRPLASHILVASNVIMNCYDIDGNHDDGIQSYNLGKYNVTDITIRGNLILNYEDPNQPLLGPLQGIGCFDGPYTNWLIENNVISVNHWHGITFMGAHNCTIRNNTVIDPTPTQSNGPSWIQITNNKNGTPSSGCIVKNNIANTFKVDAVSSNNLGLKNTMQYNQTFRNYELYDFHLTASSFAIDAADDNCLSTHDFDGVERPQGISGDIGAFEYKMSTSLLHNIRKSQFKVYPNPAHNCLTIETTLLNQEIELYNTEGQLINKFQASKNNTHFSTREIPAGIYILRADGKSSKVVIQ